MATDLERLIVTLEASTKQYTNEIKKVRGDTNRMFQQMQGEITANSARVERSFATMGSKAGASLLRGMQRSLLGGAGIAGLVIGMTHLIKNQFDKAQDVFVLSKQLDVSAQKLQGWGRAAQLAGIPAESLFDAFRRINADMDDPQSFLNALLDENAWATVGRNLRTTEGRMDALADIIQKASPEQRTSILRKGGIPGEISTVLQSGAAALNEFTATTEGILTDSELATLAKTKEGFNAALDAMLKSATATITDWAQNGFNVDWTSALGFLNRMKQGIIQNDPSMAPGASVRPMSALPGMSTYGFGATDIPKTSLNNTTWLQKGDLELTAIEKMVIGARVDAAIAAADAAVAASDAAKAAVEPAKAAATAARQPVAATTATTPTRTTPTPGGLTVTTGGNTGANVVTIPDLYARALQHEIDVLKLSEHEQAVMNTLWATGSTAAAELAGKLYDYKQALQTVSQLNDNLASDAESFATQLLDGASAADALRAALHQLAQQLLHMAIQGLFNFGGAQGGLLGALVGLPKAAPGFATGGSFQVGGAGGTDSRMVAFRATPGEFVDISRPGMRGRGGGHSVSMGGIAINVEGSADERTLAIMERRLQQAQAKQMQDLQRNWGVMTSRYQSHRGP